VDSQTAQQTVTGDKNRKLDVKGTFLTILSASAFGLIAIFAKWAYAAKVDLLNLLSLRFLIAAVVMWLVVLVFRRNPRLAPKQLLILVVLGAVGYGLMSMSFFNAVKLIPASLAAILLYTYPVIVTVLSAKIEKEAITKFKIISLVISSVGLVMVVGVALQGVNLLGLFYGALAAVVYSAYIIIGNRLLKGIDPIIMTTYVMTSSAVMYNAVGWATGTVTFDISSDGWLAILGVAIVSTVIGLLTFFQAMKLLGPSKVSIISTIEPVVTSVAAFTFFGEMLTWIQIAGGLMILGAIILIQRDK